MRLQRLTNILRFDLQANNYVQSLLLVYRLLVRDLLFPLTLMYSWYLCYVSIHAYIYNSGGNDNYYIVI